MASTATATATTVVLTTSSPSAIPRSSGHRPGCNLLLWRIPTSHRTLRLRAAQETKEPETAAEATEKYGLEFGLWKIFSSKKGERGEEKSSKTDQAKELLAKYGGAYLATSITLSLISFSLCYLLVSAGVDVPALLQKVGIVVDETGGKVGTFALAYAAHKAASPIRFPPTVGLTPVVAAWIGKKKQQDEESGGDGN